MSLLDDPQALRSLVDGLPEALVVADPQGVIRYWNGAAARLFGHAREEAWVPAWTCWCLIASRERTTRASRARSRPGNCAWVAG